jgi:hypothetical protein
VADQQEDAQNKRTARTEPAQRRRTLELARIDVLRRLEGATGAYKEMLLRSLAAVDEELARLG